MIKDFRYIIKRVIIGVLICIAISCINSCKVKALDEQIIDLDNGTYINTFNYCNNYDSYIVYNLSDTTINSFSSEINNWNYNTNNGNRTIRFVCFNKSDYETTDGLIVFDNNSKVGNKNNQKNLYIGAFLTNNGDTYNYIPINNGSEGNVSLYRIRGNVGFNGIGTNYVNGYEKRDTYYKFNQYPANIYIDLPQSPWYEKYYYELGKNYGESFENNIEPNKKYVFSANTIIDSNVDIYVYDCPSNGENFCSTTTDNTNKIWDTSYNLHVPSIVNIESAPLIKNNILVEMSLFPVFSNFDSENYDYQYGFSSDNDLPDTWLSLEYNYQWLQFRANGTFFVRIKDKSNDEIIATSTFTIDNMGRPVEDEDAYIDISSEYRTRNFLNNNISSGSYSNIAEVQLYLDYNPKSSFYRYFYQYIPVENGEYATEPNNNNWEELASSNNGSRTYVVSQNGVMFAKMEDIDGNVVATANYKVENIGDLAIDNPNENNTNAWYNRIGKKLNFGGPIGSLINIPITLLRTIYNGINGVGGVCYNYNLGSLWGTNLSLPCVNLSSYLGPLYTTIDIICSSVMIYFIFKMLSMAYDKFLRMERDPLSAEDFYRDNKD